MMPKKPTDLVVAVPVAVVAVAIAAAAGNVAATAAAKLGNQARSGVDVCESHSHVNGIV